MSDNDDEHGQRIEKLRNALLGIYALADVGVPDLLVNKTVREAVFFMYEAHNGSKHSAERPHSAAARAFSHSGTNKFKRSVTCDHAIPYTVLRESLRVSVADPEEFAAVLYRYVQYVIITNEENKKLERAGLRHRMPGGAKQDDMLARYQAVGIGFEPEDEGKLRPV